VAYTDRSRRKLASLKTIGLSKHSDRGDLTHLSATALARGDLNDVRTYRIPTPRPRRSSGGSDVNAPEPGQWLAVRLEANAVRLFCGPAPQQRNSARGGEAVQPQSVQRSRSSNASRGIDGRHDF
jgi:hypothetical protein